MRATAIAFGTFLILAAGATAEPAKHGTPKPAARPQNPVIVLASADSVRAPAPSTPQVTSAPAKRITPRVTTCRCGDPQPDPDPQEQ